MEFEIIFRPIEDGVEGQDYITWSVEAESCVALIPPVGDTITVTKGASDLKGPVAKVSRTYSAGGLKVVVLVAGKPVDHPPVKLSESFLKRYGKKDSPAEGFVLPPKDTPSDS